MKKVVLVLLAAACVSCSPQASSDKASADKDVAAWERQARNVTIIRDDWGIAHVYGKTDADAVFGVMYAQAEDDFNRVETNYLNSMGRLAEAEGEAEVYRDLRMKLFIDPDDMKAQYEKSPEWLKEALRRDRPADAVAHPAEPTGYWRDTSSDSTVLVNDAEATAVNGKGMSRGET